MMQTASAFASVQKSLSFFVTIYRTLAEWRAVVARLDGFEMSIASAATLATTPIRSTSCRPHGGNGDRPATALVSLPNGTPLVSADGFSLRGNERTLVTGPSGAGKSTLFRAIAGIWPFGSGSIAIPADATLMMLPQRPYFPIGSLQAAIVYPGEAGASARTRSGRRSRWSACRSSARGWTRRRTGTGCSRWASSSASGWRARCCTRRNICSSMRPPPRSTSPRRPRSTACCSEKLPETTIVSIGHRSTLEAFHQRNVAMVRDGDRFTLQGQDAAIRPAAG